MFPRSLSVTKYAVGVLLVGLATLVSCKKEDPKSNLAGLTSFSIKDLNVPFTIDETQRIIQNVDSLPFQTDVSAYVANFTAVPLSTVKVGGVVQVSGTTVNDFSEPLQYDVVAEDGVTTRSYTVRVNVAQIDPNTVAWNQVVADAGWSYYRTVAGAYNNKLWLFGKTRGDSWNGVVGKVGAYNSTDGVNWSEISAKLNDELMPTTLEASFIVFKNKMWLLGGHTDGFGAVTNNVFSSTDGVTWEATAPTGDEKWWIGRQRIPTVVFKDKLWVIGGNAFPYGNNLDYSGTPMRDIWSSSTGTAWDSVIAMPAFTPRSNPAVFVFQDKIWLIGGREGDGFTANYLNDVWNSSDGKNWTKVSTSGTIFTPRWGHQVVVYNDEIFLVGGESETGVLNDFWVSSDGVTWDKVEAGNPRALPANFPARAFFSMFVENNNVYIIGGRGEKVNNKYTLKNDVWKGNLVK